MKKYEIAVEKSVTDVKKFLMMMDGYDKPKLGEVLNQSIFLKDLITNVQKDVELFSYVKIYLKNKIENACNLNEIEELFVYFNLFIPVDSITSLLFKRKILTQLLNRYYFNEQLYCVIRHITGYSTNDIEPFVEYIVKGKNDLYHHMMIAIHCIEKRYNEAYPHLKVVGVDVLEVYQKQLYLYKPFKYSRIMSSNICSTLKTAYSN